MDAREGRSVGTSAGAAKTAASSAVSSSTSTALASTASPSTSCSAAAAPASIVLGSGLEALHLLGGAVGGGPRLKRVLGGLSFNYRPYVLAGFLGDQDLYLGREWRFRPIVDRAPGSMDAHQSRRRVA